MSATLNSDQFSVYFDGGKRPTICYESFPLFRLLRTHRRSWILFSSLCAHPRPHIPGRGAVLGIGASTHVSVQQLYFLCLSLRYHGACCVIFSAFR